MDDEGELDYEPMDGEIPEPRTTIRGSSQRRGGVQSCPVCSGRFTNVQRHVICCHLSWYVSPNTACWTCKLQLAQEKLLQVHILNLHNGQDTPHKFDIRNRGIKWVYLMNGLLHEISEQLAVKTEGLVKYVRAHSDFSVCSGEVHHCTDIPLLQLFNKENQYTPPYLTDKVYAPTDPHSLLHWKVLAVLILHTESGENLVSFEKEHNLHTALIPKPVDTYHIIDTHFHLDMYTKETRCSGLPNFSWEDDHGKIILNFLVANYCFPEHWPSSKDRHNLRQDSRLRFTFGIHPNLVKSESKKTLDSWLWDLDNFTEAKKVVGIGECGIDARSGITEKELDKQIKIFEGHLQIARAKRLPVVVHCRGDNCIQDTCFKVMKKMSEKEHPIHKHCFMHTLKTYKRWRSHFVNCKFGVSPFILMDEKHPDLRSTICDMSLQDLVIETDAPYISESGSRKGCPSLAIEIARKLSVMFDLPVQDISSVTTSNAMKLYNIS